MTTDKKAARIAVIGLGPRGLGALEKLASLIQDNATPLGVDVFDPFPAPGAGPNFDPKDSPVCLLNIPFRDIAIDGPATARCPGFGTWLNRPAPPDSFPPRADLGRYLEARLADLQTAGRLSLAMIAQNVDRVEQTQDGWTLHAAGHTHGPYAEVLLTLGQPQVTPDDQLAAWQDHAAKTATATLAPAYPARDLIAAAAGWTDKTVAIRGLALSTFDLLRMLTIGQGGRFERDRYYPSGQEPALILPFSLDGKPPFPKPATTAVDATFAPLQAETQAFSTAMAMAVQSPPDQARHRINAALAQAVLRIMRTHDPATRATEVDDWLETEWSAPGTQEPTKAHEILDHGIRMAQGLQPPSIGYAVGQVWRKWQNPLRAGFNSTQTEARTAQAILGFDEGLKRYSYGPPLSSSRALRALMDCGLVDLDLCADPDIALTQAGWTLTKDSRTATASVMIDGVMPPPDLTRITAEPVAGLVATGRIVPCGKGLAARTAPDGRLLDDTGQTLPGLCLLGRLALGSVIAADSLHDCFGRSGDRWAAGVIQRLRLTIPAVDKNAPDDASLIRAPDPHPRSAP